MRRIHHVVLSTFVLGSVLASTAFARDDWALLGTRKVSLAKETDVIVQLSGAEKFRTVYRKK